MKIVKEIPDYLYYEVEKLMLGSASKKAWCNGYAYDDEEELALCEEPTDEEWKAEVIDICEKVIPYMECNSSVRAAYIDMMY